MEMINLCVNCMKEKEAPDAVCPHCGYDPSSHRRPSHALRPFAELNGKYVIGKVLGTGNYDITYIAYEKDSLENPVVIKEFFMRKTMFRNGADTDRAALNAPDEAAERLYQTNRMIFKREALLLAGIENMDGIANVREYFEENNTSYMAIDYLEGITLSEYILSSGGSIFYREILEKIRPVIRSLQKIHREYIYHRNISPDKLMLMTDGSIRLFGLGGIRDESSEGVNFRVNPGFSPIERYFRRELGPWTDEYSLAATMYYAITGQKVPEAVARNLDNDILIRPTQLVPDLPPHIDAALVKALSIKKEDRFQEMEDFESALYVEEAPSGKHRAVRKPFSSETKKAQGRKITAPFDMKTLAIAGTALLLCIAAAVVVLVVSGRGGHPSADSEDSGNAAGIRAELTPAEDAPPSVSPEPSPAAASAPADGGSSRAQSGEASDKAGGSAADLEIVREAAENGDAESQYHLGSMYYSGNGVERDLVEAAKWYRKAADQGYAEAQYGLGILSLIGDNENHSSQDYKQAASWYRKAADQGFPKAQNNLGSLYYNGYGVEQDYEEAAKWYKLAADQGLDDAQYNLGLLYFRGDGVAQSYAEAAKWYGQAADQGYAPAEFSLGYLYEYGYGVEQNYEEAARWYGEAAAQDYAAAEFRLGLLYREGKGVGKDAVKGDEWIQKAADQGYAQAQEFLK